MVGYSEQIDIMWVGVFDSHLLAAIALMVLFMVLCFKRNLDASGAMVVMLPLVIGITTSNEMYPFVQNILIIIPMAVIGFAIIKFFAVR